MSYVHITPKVENLRRAQRAFEKQVRARTIESEKLRQALAADLSAARRSAERSHLVSKITAGILAADDFVSCLGVILRRICEYTNWCCGEAWLPSEDGTALRYAGAWHAESEPLTSFENVSRNLLLSPGEDLAGRVWLSRRPEWVGDVAKNLLGSRAEIAARADFKGCLAVPVLAGDHLLCILDFFMNKPDDNDSDWVDIVSATGSELSVALKHRQADDQLRRLHEIRELEMKKTNEPLDAEIAERSRQYRELARQHRTLAEISQIALGGIELFQLIEKASALVARTLDVEFSKILELLPDGQSLRLRAGVGWRDGLVGQATLEADVQSQASYTLCSEDPIIVDDLRRETRFSGAPLLHEHEIISGMSVVIPGRRRPFGVLGVHTRTRRIFSKDEATFLKDVANVLSQAIERKTVEARLRKSREDLRALAARLQSVREEERTLLAREIHDEFSGTLAELKMDLSLISSRIDPKEAVITQKIGTMNALIDSTLDSVRNVAARLRPGVLDDLGLIAAIEWQARDFQKRFGIQCELNLEPEELCLKREQATAIFRIFQETLTNVARHAKATTVWITLKEQPGQLTLSVRDDGRGISEEEIFSSTSLGLLGMRERALVFGGEVLITSAPREGTTVTLKMPARRL